MNCQAIFVSNNHTQIQTIKLSTDTGYFLINKKRKRYVEGFDITEYHLSKTRDLIIPRMKNTKPGNTQSEKQKCMIF